MEKEKKSPSLRISSPPHRAQSYSLRTLSGLDSPLITYPGHSKILGLCISVL